VPGEYPLVEASSSPDGTIGASVILPKDLEKVFPPMAIYGEEVAGTLTLLRDPSGRSLPGRRGGRPDRPWCPRLGRRGLDRRIGWPGE